MRSTRLASTQIAALASILLLASACGDAPGGMPSGTDAAGADTGASTDADTGFADGSGKADDLDDTGATADSDTSADTSTDAGRPDTGPDLPILKICDDADPPEDLSTVDWNNFGSRVVAEMSPNHTASDMIFSTESRVRLEGKFTYGSVSKDLEGELVQFWMDDCSGSYRKLGETKTNSDGKAKLSIPPGAFDGPGVFDLWMRVKGDGTTTRATLRLLPKGTKLIVFDIDGTLTKGDRELANDIISDVFKPLGSGDYVPETRSGSARITELRRADQGYQLVYLTARPYWLTDITRSWLHDRGMAPGNLEMTPSNSQALPTKGSTGTYKKKFIQSLQDEGFQIHAAYGNSDTDVYAYEEAGTPKKKTFIVGEEGGLHNTVDLGDNYNQHLQDLGSMPPTADQPFLYP